MQSPKQAHVRKKYTLGSNITTRIQPSSRNKNNECMNQYKKRMVS
ncbi:hypothetical protein, unlikely [Trypanosoma brucei brucei TREU927]|uniref:Uncharacterized protein n=1 Tax=Trypanosoma brucei brucei (strain 927/4 GUTat10.1) TaxID=185431 RepID=Q38F21_TRYB2|nr:hypothetical protein, unlikely [Trypanosoma brucei brucei TREU927]EAN76599.1 hypothetical protein, unlikely [Trypanosoma brucei brucei TREU927]